MDRHRKRNRVVYRPANNRSQVIRRGSNTIILDAYNANPNSMEAAIDNLKGLDAKKKVAVLGDMFEVGADSAAEHQKIAELISFHTCGCDLFHR